MKTATPDHDDGCVGGGEDLLRCNADLVKSFGVPKPTSLMGHKGRFYRRVLLKENPRSRSLPSSLDDKPDVEVIETSVVECSDVENSKLLPNGDSSRSRSTSPVSDLWFNTWPERYDKLKESPTKDETHTGINKKVSLNEALESISLAYSPITKQLHLVKRDVEESVCGVSEIRKVEENGLNEKNVRCGHSRSSTISSLSDFSATGSLLDTDGRITPTSDATHEQYKKRKGSFFNKNVFSWKLFGKSKTASTQQPHSPQHSGIVASSSALIQNKRPSTLPAKNKSEEQRHCDEYQAILTAAKKKEAQSTAAKQRQQKIQLQLEEQQANATKYFTQVVFPNWENTYSLKRTRDFWWHGLPPSVRGRLWKLAIGNDLNLTEQLHDICVSRAQTRLNGRGDPLSKPDSEATVEDQESSMDVIRLDIARTFPALCIFQEGGPYSESLHSLLAAYVCYRPDVGYVQGMSYIAAVLILNMEPYDAFVCFANLLNRPLHVAAFTLNQKQMRAYYSAFDEVFNHNLPKLYLHFVKAGLTPDMYLLDWIYTVYAKAMPLDVACRVWDVFLRDGDEFLFRTGLGILHLHREALSEMDFLHGAQFLTRLPEDMSSDNLFRSIQAVSTGIGKQSFGQIVERCEKSIEQRD